MNATKSILFIFCLTLINHKVQAQNISHDSIYWDNGNLTLLPELGQVIIVLKKGSNIKEARIIEIKKQKGVLVYEKEKCLHDINISNIKKIEPGKNAVSHLYFNLDNTPYIKKEYLQMDALVKYSDFKSTKPELIDPNYTKEEKQSIVNSYPSENMTPSITKNYCDTIIETNGRVVLVKIIALDEKFVSYKKISNPDGPKYIASAQGARVTKYNNCVSVNFNK